MPAATRWSHFHQLDEGEFTCSSAQAQHSWCAEAVFGRVVKSRSVNGTIPMSFLNYVEQAHAVAYLDVFLQDFNVEPKGWGECESIIAGTKWQLT